MDVTSSILVSLPIEEQILALVKASVALLSVKPPWECQAPQNKFTLAGLTALLSFEDSACVLTVRKVHRLGGRSAEVLREEFSKLASVDKVLLLPGRIRSDGPPKIASMAFVVMASVQASQTILSAKDQFSRSMNILVQPFVLHQAADSYLQ
jgi:hypothetical protein